MFEPSRIFSGFAVTDIEAATAFYGDTLGLTVSKNEMGILTIELGNGASVIAYPKPNHTPASYTILNFEVADVDTAVDALVAKGVEFTRYPGMPQDERGIMKGNGPDIAWFEDPAGNILSVLAG